MSDVTHRFEITTRIADVPATEMTRYSSIMHVQATPDDGDFAYLAATDTKILAVVSVPAECPNETFIPASVIPAPTGRRLPTVQLNGNWQNSKGQFANVPESGRFPKAPDVMPDLTSGKWLAVGINAELLRTLQRAVNGKDETTLTVFLPLPTDEESKENGGQVCQAIPVVGTEGIGVIMPITLGDGHLGRYSDLSDRFANYERMRRAFTAARDAVDAAKTV